MDFAAEGLLDGLDGDARAAREQLLTRLADDGFALGRAAQRAWPRTGSRCCPWTGCSAAATRPRRCRSETGLPAETLLRIRRLLGLPDRRPDDRVFCDEDVEAARATQLFLDAGFSQERGRRDTRVLGEGMTRLAATITAAFVEPS